jgi:hypothetical protein
VKNVGSDRDSSVGRLLAETLEAHAALAPEGSCLTAETLAAWADDALASSERLQAEAHAAGCSRCQTLLAVMMKTAPPAAARTGVWRIPALGWLIPVGAAAAAVLVWAIVPGRSTIPSTGRSPALVDRIAPAVPPVASTPARAEAQLQRQSPASRPLAGSNAPLAAQRGLGDASRPPMSPAARELSRAAVVAGSPASQIPAAIGGAAARASPAAPGKVIVSPSPLSRWRIVAGGVVERSTDGGSTWQVQETGATVPLAGGVSPSPSVCWLVGPAGTVLLSTDGQSWRRVAFPEAADLTSVDAAGDTIASVTASDGRTFSTRDGGLTWLQSGNAR